ARDLRLLQLRCDCRDDTCGHPVLQIEDVLQRPIEMFRPEVNAGGSLDELAGDTHAVRRPAIAAFEHIAHAELAADLANVDSPVLESKARVTRDHEQPADTTQRSDDV